MLSSIESFLPSPAVQIKLEHVEIDQKEVNSLQDVVWTASNQAHSRLVKRTGQAVVAAKMDANNQKDQRARFAARQKKVAATVMTAIAIDDDDLPPPPAALSASVPTSAPRPSLSTSGKPKKADQREAAVIEVPVPTTVPVGAILTLEQHKRRDDELALFAVTVERPHRATNDVIINTPPAVTVLAYCAQYKGELPWYKNMQQSVANSSTITFQDTPVFRRSYIVTFLRQPDPATPYERPCYNLDREPLAHENRVRCIAHRLSEEILGLGRGYRLREILFKDQSLKINAAIDHNQRAAKLGMPLVDTSSYLTEIPELCYMCHIW
jgi:cell pole-organizing protein PopZ